MNYRDLLRENLSQEEGIRLKMYKCPAGYSTIGIGHNCDAHPLPKQFEQYLNDNGELTMEMVEQLFNEDMEDAESDTRKFFPGFEDFTEVRKAALIDMVFNLGRSRFAKFAPTIQLINEDKWDAAASRLAATKWYRQVGKRGPKIVKMIKGG